MNIPRFAVENQVVTSVIIGVTLVAGIGTYFQLPRAEDPGFTVRTAIVSTPFPGASPRRVESLVTDPLEEEIEEIEEVDYLESESRTGQSVIWVNVEHEHEDMTPIWDDLREKVSDAAPQLPAEAAGPFVNDEFGDVFSTLVMMTGDGLSPAEMEETADRVRARLLDLDHAAKVEITGVREERVFVEYDPSRLVDTGLSASRLAEILRDRNILLPGGEIRTARERMVLEPSGNFESVEDIRRMSVPLPSGELVQLRDIADIRRGYEDPPRVKVKYRGEPALALGVSMQPDGKITELGPEILSTLEELRSDLPVGIEFHTVSYRAGVVEEDVNAFTSNLLQGILAVLLVVLFALGLRTGLVVASIVPITMIGSLLVMAAMEITLNKISLAGLIMSLGLLVDSAIVVVESIIVEMRQGKDPIPAALDSVRELAYPLVVGAATTSLALLPTYIAPHQVAEYTSAIFEVVTISLFLAWCLALTVLPMLSVRFLARHRADGGGGGVDASGPGGRQGDAEGGIGDGPDDGDGTASAFYRRYRRFLLLLLRNRGAALAAAVGILALAVYSFRFVPQNFIPRKAETLFTAELELPRGTPFERTEAVATDLENFLRDSLSVGTGGQPLRAVPRGEEAGIEGEGLVNWATFLGQGAPRYNLGYAPEQPRVSYAHLLLNATSYGVQDSLIRRMEGFLAERYPEVIPRIEKLRNGPPIDYPVEIRLSGPDPDRLLRHAAAVAETLRRHDGATNVSHDWGRRVKRVEVGVHDDRARRAGLTSRDVALSLQTRLSGLELTEYRERDDLVPVILRSEEAGERGVEKLDGLRVVSQRRGESVPLGQVADVGLTFQPSRILRRGRERTVTVQADLAPSAGSSTTAFSVTGDLEPWLAERSEEWPAGYDYAVGGEPESSGEVQSAIRAGFPMAALLILLVLVFEFNSLRKPGIILLTIPFAATGVVLGLLITQMQFGFMALLGVIGLVGIVINNAVVLIDRIEIEQQEHGLGEQEAILEASRRRLRPILLTTATTIGGLLPLWIGGDVMFQPMAVAIIFGLLLSTLLTLGLVPVLYSLFFGVGFEDHDPADAAAR
jgi:multidrug efflux pump subunit AcrB